LTFLPSLRRCQRSDMRSGGSLRGLPYSLFVVSWRQIEPGTTRLRTLGKTRHRFQRPRVGAGKHPPRYPHPPGVAVLATAERLAAIALADPFWSAKRPVWAGRKGGASVAGVTPTGLSPSCPHSVGERTSARLLSKSEKGHEQTCEPTQRFHAPASGSPAAPLHLWATRQVLR
jgi:hypothetical protein